jgi:hypothetical protein
MKKSARVRLMLASLVILGAIVLGLDGITRGIANHNITIEPVALAQDQATTPDQTSRLNNGGPAVPATVQNVKDGVPTDGAKVQSAQPGFINFDPPCFFEGTLPLDMAPYMNPGTKAYFTRGEGSVLNQCGNFSVTGHSAPNFLAWNCGTSNFDGSKPALPAEIKFIDPVSSVSINVGSHTDAGETSKLIAYDVRLNRIAITSTTLTSSLKKLTVTATGIKTVRLTGPCVMVADDLTVKR